MVTVLSLERRIKGWTSDFGRLFWVILSLSDGERMTILIKDDQFKVEKRKDVVFEEGSESRA